MSQQLQDILASAPDLAARLNAIKSFSKKIRVSEYHITTACNIRCEGCWFFEHDFDKATRDEKSLDELRAFLKREKQRGITSALLIGGEPTLYPERVAVYRDELEWVSISTNGLKALPREGFENINVFVTLFGGGPVDDQLRGIKPNGSRFSGLFDTALANYKDDPRVCFVYAITERATAYIEDTVRKIRDNGNRVTFNFYSEYSSKSPLLMFNSQALLEEALRVKAKYPDTVLSTPYYIRTMVSGKSHWGSFGYENCPSISIDHPAHKERLQNGNRALPLFNTYAPDLKTINFCCTSGHCGDCRDSQAVFSWLLVSADKFMGSAEELRQWVDLSESYWGQFVWSPVRPQAFVRPAVEEQPKLREAV
jgi:hypothetical protein